MDPLRRLRAAERFARARELRQWAAAGMDVGAHTRHHVDLQTLGTEAARDEIVGAKRELEATLGSEVRHFCYPFGSFNADHRAIAEEAGYHSATTVQRGRACAADDRFACRARNSHRASDGGSFRSAAAGWDDIVNASFNAA